MCFFSVLFAIGFTVDRNVSDTLLIEQTRHKSVIKLRGSTDADDTNQYERFSGGIQLKMNNFNSLIMRYQRSAFTIRLNTSTMSIVKSDEKPSRNDSNYSQRPLFASLRKYAQLSFEPSIYKCDHKQSTDCQNKTKEFMLKILNEFQKSLVEPLEEAASMNAYNVEYEHLDDMIKYNPTCMVLDAKLRILTNKDSPFDTNKIGRMFPIKKLFGKRYLSIPRSCVIVSSAGSLHRSGLGKFIGIG